MQEYATNVLRRRAEANVLRPEPALKYFLLFQKTIRDEYSAVTWTSQALRELYVELERMLSALKSWNELEADEAVILLFGSHTDLLKNLRKSANSNTAPKTVFVKMVESSLRNPPRPPAVPKQTWWQYFTGSEPNAPPVKENLVINGIANAVHYFLKTVIKEAIDTSKTNGRQRINKYDVVLALEKIKKTTIRKYIAKKETRFENDYRRSPTTAMDWAPARPQTTTARPYTPARPQAATNGVPSQATQNLIRTVLDESEVLAEQAEMAFREADTSRREKKFAEDALAQCKRDLDWIRQRYQRNRNASE